MKRIYTILLAVLLTASVFAQAPQKMTFQAVVRNGNGQLTTNTQVGIEINIYQSSVTGMLVYTETQTPTTNVNGLLTIEIGGQTGFDTITWVNGPYFLETKIDPGNSGTYTIIGTNQLLTVPYALHAKTAERITGGINETDPVYTAWNKSYNDLTNTPNIKDSVTSVLDTTTQFVRTELDANPANEIQTISRTGLTVTLNNGGGTYQDSVNTQNLNNVLTQGTDAGNKNITNLANPVNVQDAATKAYVDHKFDLLITAMNGLTDNDGNHYNAVLIGDQIWMAEDLRVTHYPNGSSIPNITNNTDWTNLGDNNTDDAYCFYNNDNTTDYGALYTYAAAIADNWTNDLTNGQGICPNGWHLPTDTEWSTLRAFLGSNTGSKLAGSAPLWIDGDLDQSDDFAKSGFSALPGGNRDYSDDGTFIYLGGSANWWSATEVNGSNANFYIVFYTATYFANFDEHKSTGFSVRCIKD